MTELNEGRCAAIAESLIPLRLRHLFSIGTYEPTLPGTPARYGPPECTAYTETTLDDADVSFNYDEKKVLSAEGEKVLYEPQRSRVVGEFKQAIRGVPGCRFTDFHSYTRERITEMPGWGGENHAHFQCDGPYTYDEWKNHLNKLVRILGDE